MTHQLTAAAPRVSSWQSWKRDLGVALLAAAAVVLVHAARGFPLIVGPNADNDSLLRMVQVLDFLAGQNWYDLHQYRMGPPGGFIMHWSRFVDAPIAALLLLARAITGSLDAAEKIVEVVYPALLLIAAMFLLLRLVRLLGKPEALLPTTIVGAVALYNLPLFQSAALDHHNIQLVLVLTTILFLISAPERPLAGFISGAAAAVSLVIGMETAPYVALAGVIVALGFLFRGSAERLYAAAFGAGFAGISLLSFLSTVPWPLWSDPRCDAFTLPQMSVAVLAGTGLTATALFPACHGSQWRRTLSLLAVAGAVAALLLLAFPQCIAAPYAALDPRLRAYWMGSISEAQSIRQVLQTQPAMVATYYCTPVLGALVLVWRSWRVGPQRPELIFAAFLVAAIFVSLWQIRGMFFSIPLSAVPLAIWVGDWRAKIEREPSRYGSLKLAAVWLLSFNFVWSTATQAAVARFSPEKAAGDAAVKGDCVSPKDYSALAALPSTTVLAVTNLGAPILRYTRHRVLAGPYHRDVQGGLAMLDAFTGTDADARGIVRRYGVTLVASCAGNAETRKLKGMAPHGLAARLAEGDVPSWLSAIPASPDSALRLFRVDPQAVRK